MGARRSLRLERASSFERQWLTGTSSPVIRLVSCLEHAKPAQRCAAMKRSTSHVNPDYHAPAW